MSEPPHASSWAAPPEFYIDENMAGRTVRRFITDLGYLVHTPASVFGRERLKETVLDEDWLPVAGERGWVVFGRDQQILERENELRAYLDAKVHMFLLPGKATRDLILLLPGTVTSARLPARVARPLLVSKTGVMSYERRRASATMTRKRAP